MVRKLSNPRFGRVEMPMLEGENLERWVFRGEKFFSMHCLTEMEKLDIVAISFKRGSSAMVLVGRLAKEDEELQ